MLRYTVVQDVGKAIHPAYVEGQLQGGAAQGIGWALNEEYVYGPDGVLQNPGFLDYRVPVASDLPRIDTVIVEVPNPNHPYGVRGCGEVPIIAPMATIANAIKHAVGVRLCEQPMSPPRVLKAIEEAEAAARRREAVARVQLSSSLKPYTDGASELEVQAVNVRQLLQQIGERYPQLQHHLEHDIAVAIDGVVYQDALLQPISGASEVILIDKIAGG